MRDYFYQMLAKLQDSREIIKAIYKSPELVQINGGYSALVTYYLFIGDDVNIILYGDTTWELGTDRYNEIPSKSSFSVLLTDVKLISLIVEALLQRM